MVINDYTDRAALVRGLSTVAEAELVTNQPTNADWSAINARAREITSREAQGQSQRAEAQASSAEQQLAERAIERSSAEHAAELSAEPAGAER